MFTRTLLVLALAACATGSAAEEPAGGVFCATLDSALKAAEESPAFGSIGFDTASAPGSSRLTIPGFPDHDCRVSYDSDDEGRKRVLWCSRNLAPPELTAANLAADTRRCLGREPVIERGATGAGGDYRFDLGRVEIVIDEHCNDRCHVGRIISYRILSRVVWPPAA